MKSHDLQGFEIQGAYWLPEDGTILFLTKARQYFELGVGRRDQEKSGVYPRIWGVKGGASLFDARVDMVVIAHEYRVVHKYKASIATLHIRTNQGACVVIAAMEKVSDDNDVAFTLEPFIGYPPVDAVRLVDLEDGLPQEAFDENGPTQH